MSKIIPEKEEKKWLKAIEHQPFSALLLLGKLFFLKENNAQAHEALDLILPQVTCDHLESIFNALDNLSEDDVVLLDPKTKQGIQALQLGLLAESNWAKQCSTKLLEQLGCELALLRWAMVRLIQQANPKQSIEVEPALLNEAGIEHTSELLAHCLQAAKILPTESLLKLAQSEQAAQIILTSLSTHPKRFNLAKQCIEKFPTLAPKLAIEWDQLTKTIPLTQEAQQNLEKEVEQLLMNHPEFKGINHQQRIQQKPIEDNNAKANPYSNIEFYAAGAWTLINSRRFYQFSHACYVGVRSLIYNTPGPTPAALGFSALMVGTHYIAPIATYLGGEKAYRYFKGTQS